MAISRAQLVKELEPGLNATIWTRVQTIWRAVGRNF